MVVSPLLLIDIEKGELALLANVEYGIRHKDSALHYNSLLLGRWGGAFYLII